MLKEVSELKISVLSENTTNVDGIFPEHGLSLLIETEEKHILFDAGQSGLFVDNAICMGIDLGRVDIAVLSHGHYDHSGGFNKFLEINKKAKIYVNENAFKDYYNGTEKYIGIDDELKTSNRLVVTGDEYVIDTNLKLFTENNENREFLSNSDGLNIKEGNCFCQDNFNHEHYLEIFENGKKYLFSSCSHKGVLNIEKWFQPDYFIGGFHISKLNPDTDDKHILDNIANELLNYSTRYYTGHCTGVDQYKYLKSIMGDKLEYISAGRTLNL